MENGKMMICMSKKEVKRFYRSIDDQVLFGVCAGVAEYFEISPATFDSWEHLYDIVKKVVGAVNQQPKKQLDPQQQYFQSLQDKATQDYNLYQSLEDQVKSGKSISKSEYQDLDNENNHMETVFLGILDKDKKDAVFTDNLNDEAVTSEKIDSELFTGVETTGRENYEENMPDYRLNINLQGKFA